MEIYLGAQYESYKEFINKFHVYCKTTGQLYRIDWSRTVSNYNKMLLSRRKPEKKKSPVLPVDASWQYTHINYVCVHGGRHRLYRAKLKNPTIRSIPGVCPASLLVAYNRHKNRLVVVRANFLHNHGLKSSTGYVARNEITSYLGNPEILQDELEDEDDGEAVKVENVQVPIVAGQEEEISCSVEIVEGASDDDSVHMEYIPQGTEYADKEKSPENSKLLVKILGSDNSPSKDKVAKSNSSPQKSPIRKTPKKSIVLNRSSGVKTQLMRGTKPDMAMLKTIKSQAAKTERVRNLAKTLANLRKDKQVVTICARDPDEDELGLVAQRCTLNPIDPEKAEILISAVEALNSHLKETRLWNGTDEWYFKSLAARLNLPMNRLFPTSQLELE